MSSDETKKKKRNPLDPREQIAGGRRVCAWCYPHYKARLEGRSCDHTHCNDLACGCHCQDRTRVN